MSRRGNSGTSMTTIPRKTPQLTASISRSGRPLYEGGDRPEHLPHGSRVAVVVARVAHTPLSTDREMNGRPPPSLREVNRGPERHGVARFSVGVDHVRVVLGVHLDFGVELVGEETCRRLVD